MIASALVWVLITGHVQATGLGESNNIVPTGHVKDPASEWLVAGAVEAEIQALEEHQALLRRKAAVLAQYADILRSQLGQDAGNVSRDSYPTPAPPARSRPKLIPNTRSQALTDWFAFHGSWNFGEHSIDNYVVDMLSVKPFGTIVAKKNANHFRYAGGSTLSFAQLVYRLNKRTGLLEFYHPATHALLWQFNVQLTDIVDMVISADRTVVMAFVTKTGEVAWYKLRVQLGRRTIVGEVRRYRQTDRAECTFAVPHARGGLLPGDTVCAMDTGPLTEWQRVRTNTAAPQGQHMHMDFDLIALQPIPRRGLVSQGGAGPLAKIAVLQHHQVIRVVVADSYGMVSIYDGSSGDLINVSDFAFGQIQQMEPLTLGLLALVVRNSVYFMQALEARTLPVACQGSAVAITRVARDSWRNNQLYAGTADGRVFVFHLQRHATTRRRADGEYEEVGEARTECILTTQLTPQMHVPARPPMAIESMRTLPGYLLVATKATIQLFDTSAANAQQPLLLAAKSIAFTAMALRQNESAHDRFVSLNVARDLSANQFALITLVHTSTDGLRWDFYDSLLSPPYSSFDVGWIRAPLMLLCAVGVMYWQQRNQQRGAAASAMDDITSMQHLRAALGRRDPMPRGDWSKEM
ncbi:TPA: hypothetical protein N0F65_000015 [Lagenidium giganteum]|uniref:ER membrane protein complex subunit 1 n=1 Tax=Lagenidium giganteum TaxID=4803 RepID=A0AAV2YI99_9STRA|nr:TPA: hypothetical protein N0F65_000015 [Lagenidium giganteum]